MSTETETPTPAPVPSAGLIARLGEKFGFKTEAVAVAELKEELAAITLIANEAAAEIEKCGATMTKQSEFISEQKLVISDLQAKVSALDAIIPGITAAADPAAALTQAITLKVTEQIAAMGLPPGEAPGNDPKPSANDQKTMALADFQKLPVAEANAFMREGGKLTD